MYTSIPIIYLCIYHSGTCALTGTGPSGMPAGLDRHTGMQRHRKLSVVGGGGAGLSLSFNFTRYRKRYENVLWGRTKQIISVILCFVTGTSYTNLALYHHSTVDHPIVCLGLQGFLEVFTFFGGGGEIRYIWGEHYVDHYLLKKWNFTG